MKIKFIGLDYHHEDNVDFGTCELCMFTSDYDFPIMIFQVIKAGGQEEEVRVEAGSWGWGDYMPLYFGNLAVFAEWLNKQGDMIYPGEFDFSWLEELRNEYFDDDTVEGRFGDDD